MQETVETYGNTIYRGRYSSWRRLHLQAPCEAEAQCAALAKAGKVYAAGSEDMDTLTFGSPVLLRHLTFSEARKMPISEINLAQILEGLQFTMDEVSLFPCIIRSSQVYRPMHTAWLRLL